MFGLGNRSDNILPDEVEKRLKQGESLQIVDVRESYEVARGKIPTAKHIPLGDLPNRLKELDPQREIIMVCQSGGRSSRACAFLQQNGFAQVKNMQGGMGMWYGSTE